MAGSRDEWAGLFAELAHFCPRCGWSPSRDRCPLCRFPTDVGSDGPTLFLGRWVDVRRGMRSHRGIVVGRTSEAVKVLTEDGRPIETRRDKVRLVDGAGPREGARCGAGEVLAAAAAAASSRAGDVPAGLHDALVAHAVAIAEQGGVRQQRALVRDAFALTDPLPIVDHLDFTVSERGWWRVVALWHSGRTAGAVEEMLRLPDGRYPLRLALLWQAAASGQIPIGLAAEDRIVAIAARLGELSPAADVAARLVVRAVTRSRPRHSDHDQDADADAELTAAAVRAIDEAQAGSPWTTAGRWFRGELGEAPRSRLVGALRSSPARLGADPAVLDAAPPEVLDDLIDQAAVPGEWVDRAGELACGDHLLARTRIGMLDEDGLRRAGAVDELARRWARDGRGLPPGIPEDVRGRYAALAQAHSHDEASVMALAEAYAVDTGEVRRALTDPAALPAAPLLVLPQLAEALVDRSAVDTTALAPDDLTDDQRQFVSQVLVRRSKAALQGWDLAGAEAAAVSCLRFARDAGCRDEALNLLAAVHWQRGDDGLAQAALGATRRRGEVDGLLVNAAVVAAGTGTDRRAAEAAATELLQVVDAASNAGLRAQAALAVAAQIDDPAVRPSAVRALRTVACQPIPLDDFARVVMLLGTFDPPSLTDPGTLAGSPHVDSAPARAYVAWAAGRVDDHFEVLAAAAAAVDAAPAPWALQRRDQMVGAVLADLRAGPERRAGALALAFALLRARLAMDLETGVEVRARVVAAASLMAAAADAEPHEDVVDWLDEAVDGLAGLAERSRQRLAPLVSVGASELCRAVVVPRARQLARFEGLLGNRWTIAGDDLRETARLGLGVCEETTRLLRRLRPLVTPADRRAVDDLAERCSRLAPMLEELVR